MLCNSYLNIMGRSLVILYLILATFKIICSADRECQSLKFDQDSTVCVCDQDYCDYSDLQLPSYGEYVTITSDREGSRFKKKYGLITDNTEFSYKCYSCNEDLKKRRLILKINRTKTYQKMLGFGAAFTDAAGINAASLTQDMQDELFGAYFTPSGLNYTMGRVPIGGTDFSARPYTYDDCEGDDPQLLNFALQPEDYKYKIPYILKAREMAPEDLLLTTATWSPPLFMKNVNSFVGKNHLKKEYQEAYAQYHIKFLQEYKKHGVEFWSITPGNEPGNGLYSYFKTGVTLGWLPDNMAQFVIEHFGPAIRNSEFNKTKILLLDDSRHVTMIYLETLMEHKELKKYTDGLAFHWYFDDYVNAGMLDTLLEKEPELQVYTTEMCIMTEVHLGQWSQAETYARRIIDEMQHGSSAFIDWNYALNVADLGPAWTNNTATAIILVDQENNRFYKQPSYYAFGQFSKYIPRGSVRVQVNETTRSDLQSVAFLRPDGYVATVMHNSHNHAVHATIEDPEEGSVDIRLAPKSITTLIF